MSKDARTERYDDLWLPPVPSAAQLPDPALEGQLCFVEEEQLIYAFVDGVWLGMVARPSTARGGTTGASEA